MSSTQPDLNVNFENYNEEISKSKEEVDQYKIDYSTIQPSIESGDFNALEALSIKYKSMAIFYGKHLVVAFANREKYPAVFDLILNTMKTTIETSINIIYEILSCLCDKLSENDKLSEKEDLIIYLHKHHNIPLTELQLNHIITPKINSYYNHCEENDGLQDENAFIFAKEYSNLLNYYLTNDCPTDENTLKFAKKYNNLAVLEFLQKKGVSLVDSDEPSEAKGFNTMSSSSKKYYTTDDLNKLDEETKRRIIEGDDDETREIDKDRTRVNSSIETSDLDTLVRLSIKYKSRIQFMFTVDHLVMAFADNVKYPAIFSFILNILKEQIISTSYDSQEKKESSLDIIHEIIMTHHDELLNKESLAKDLIIHLHKHHNIPLNSCQLNYISKYKFDSLLNYYYANTKSIVS